jgi:hypothetical protein
MTHIQLMIYYFMLSHRRVCIREARGYVGRVWQWQ